MRLFRIAAIVAAALFCAPIAAQNVGTLPAAATLTGSERLAAVQGAGCASHVAPCAAVAITPPMLATYLGGSGSFTVSSPTGDAVYTAAATTANTGSAGVDLARLGGTVNVSLRSESEIADDYAHLRILTRGPDGLVERLRVDSGGYVGIGTATPQAKLDLNGSAIVRGGLTLGQPLPIASGGTGDAGTAWTAYTPALSCGSGSLTTAVAAGRYKKIGKTVFVRMSIGITTNGSCAGALYATLPVTPVDAGDGTGAIFIGREIAINGGAITGTVTAGTTPIYLVYYNNGFPSVDGAVIRVSGTYEAN